MCTSIILFRKDHLWPLLVGSNRDEIITRKSKFPGRHWSDNYPNIIGGVDEEKKGTWLAINDSGIMSLIHNRLLDQNNNVPKKTRGHIILNLLNLESIEEAIEYLQNLDQKNYNGFNIVIGNNKKLDFNLNIIKYI